MVELFPVVIPVSLALYTTFKQIYMKDYDSAAFLKYCFIHGIVYTRTVYADNNKKQLNEKIGKYFHRVPLNDSPNKSSKDISSCEALKRVGGRGRLYRHAHLLVKPFSDLVPCYLRTWSGAHGLTGPATTRRPPRPARSTRASTSWKTRTRRGQRRRCTEEAMLECCKIQ